MNENSLIYRIFAPYDTSIDHLETFCNGLSRIDNLKNQDRGRPRGETPGPANLEARRKIGLKYGTFFAI